MVSPQGITTAVLSLTLLINAIEGRNVAADEVCSGAMTQSDITDCFATEREKAEREMVNLYKIIGGGLSKKEKGDLSRSQEAWRHYMEVNCAAEAALYEGGSRAPSVQYACEWKMIKDREAELHLMYDNARPRQ